jgi:hypothetical protein
MHWMQHCSTAACSISCSCCLQCAFQPCKALSEPLPLGCYCTLHMPPVVLQLRQPKPLSHLCRGEAALQVLRGGGGGGVRGGWVGRGGLGWEGVKFGRKRVGCVLHVPPVVLQLWQAQTLRHLSRAQAALDILRGGRRGGRRGDRHWVEGRAGRECQSGSDVRVGWRRRESDSKVAVQSQQPGCQGSIQAMCCTVDAAVYARPRGSGPADSGCWQPHVCHYQAYRRQRCRHLHVTPATSRWAYSPVMSKTACSLYRLAGCKERPTLQTSSQTTHFP